MKLIILQRAGLFFQTKIEAAEAVVNNADATNYDVQLALANLVDAISGLEAAETPEPTPADKDKLTEVVNNCAGLEEKTLQQTVGKFTKLLMKRQWQFLLMKMHLRQM